MSEETQHLAVTVVEDEELADVTLKGDEFAIAELKESLDIETLLQRELKDWEEELDDVEVEITPRRGFSGITE